MKDYRLTVTARNNRILQMMEEFGYANVMEFCKQNKIGNPSGVYDLVNMKKSPLNRNGSWCKMAKVVAEKLCAEPDDLFSERQKTLELETNRADRMVTEQTMMALAQEQSDPEMLLLRDDRISALKEAIEGLTPRQQQVLIMRFGLDGRGAKTLMQVAEQFGVTDQRIRQIEAGALRNLRHPKHWDER